MSKFIATFAYVGLFPVAPGTAGSLVAVPLAWVLIALSGPVGLLLGAALAFGIGVWATGVETAGRADHDPGEIVIDEVAGQFLTLFPLATGAAIWGSDLATLCAGFILFRVFDILKPWPVSWADNMNTPVGVMLDDVLAGIMAAVTLWALIWMLP